MTDIEKTLDLVSQAYDLGYMKGKSDTYEEWHNFRETMLDHLYNLIQRAMVKGEYESLVYARQLIRSLTK